VRAASKQSISQELVQRIADLAARLAELTERLRRDTDAVDDVRPNDAQNLARPIEFLTENGFAIVRPWEVDNSPIPIGGSFSFLVRDPQGIECEVVVDIASQLIIETVLRTRSRVQRASSFWVCCAERHLADYLWERDGCPEANQLVVESLDCEEVLWALRWEKFDEEISDL
jgi:hypothetical protein